ncbi:bifunctional adenosylcobinamide kinase/adenosylcobinamide-phosphate guanylyltransferase [Thermanaeromonas sp. C210]|uniref:bifunctional adenosylcobinamide kinase/adenosylcobinamide-phosphate guanylyltransferase n=1 Tax=Thermanaeromonas sp. C210 TaxID=2731925 RepID=UPI00155D009E|nr:bifunctional adenosylcobinamide kinase/adenosylcobinamide-phosphate guanylyltransferase [Thermanaeromonas sp. C210]GFN23783.1 adenosylcobinamide kinase/adenosylcobinamide phosphate guanyltransferase [Thermanaeromonas sp. C210]
MERGRLVLITGGVRSGKSRFAEELAASWGEEVVYVATARVTDEEMAARVARHKARRPDCWTTVEEPVALEEVIKEWGKRGRVLLVDCLAVYVGNLLVEEGLGEEEVVVRLRKVARRAQESPADVILVSNEVGLGVVPPYPLGRLYRDLLGLANQEVASRADAVYLVVCGLPVEVKSLAVRRQLKGPGGGLYEQS